MWLWRDFWKDETGALVSAELVAVGTVAVVGGTVGLQTLSTSVNGELRELAYGVRSLNQSYAFSGHAGCRAWTAGSSYIQPPVQQSIDELCAIVGDQPTVAPQKPVEPPRKKKAKKQADANEDESAFVAPDESSLGQPDSVDPDDDASRTEVTIDPQ